jgi:ribonuclease T2
MYYLKISIIVAGMIGVMFLPEASRASIKVDGYFIAQKSCEAVHSIKKGTDPFTLTKGMAYKVMAKNKPDATHYLINIESLEENPNKWVSIDCGILLTDCKISQTEKPVKEKSYLLAISWQPAFCQSHQSKIECETQTEDRYDATHLALHGLWPQPKNNAYCNVSDKDKSLDRKKCWEQLDSLHLSDNLYTELLVVMPGVGSYLQRHEWIKHGTCYSDSPEIYYRDSMKIVNQINDTNISVLFAENIGNTITAKQIRQAFDEAFGEGSGERVNVKCGHKGLIAELWVNLKGDIGNDNNLSRLLQDAPVVNRVSCEGGIVDAVGF